MRERERRCIVHWYAVYLVIQSVGVWGRLGVGDLPGTRLAVQSDSSRKEGPSITLRHIVGVKQSVTDGATQCCQSHARGWNPSQTGMLAWPTSSCLPPPRSRGPPRTRLALLTSLSSVFLSVVEMLLPSRPFHSARCPCCVEEGAQECPLHSKWPLSLHKLESAVAFLLKCLSAVWPVQFIVEVNTQVFMSPLSQRPFPGCWQGSEGGVCAWGNPPQTLWSSCSSTDTSLSQSWISLSTQMVYFCCCKASVLYLL